MEPQSNLEEFEQNPISKNKDKKQFYKVSALLGAIFIILISFGIEKLDLHKQAFSFYNEVKAKYQNISQNQTQNQQKSSTEFDLENIQNKQLIKFQEIRDQSITKLNQLFDINDQSINTVKLYQQNLSNLDTWYKKFNNQIEISKQYDSKFKQCKADIQNDFSINKDVLEQYADLKHSYLKLQSEKLEIHNESSLNLLQLKINQKKQQLISIQKSIQTLQESNKKYSNFQQRVKQSERDIEKKQKIVDRNNIDIEEIKKKIEQYNLKQDKNQLLRENLNFDFEKCLKELKISRLQLEDAKIESKIYKIKNKQYENNQKITETNQILSQLEEKINKLTSQYQKISSQKIRDQIKEQLIKAQQRYIDEKKHKLFFHHEIFQHKKQDNNSVENIQQQVEQLDKKCKQIQAELNSDNFNDLDLQELEKQKHYLFQQQQTLKDQIEEHRNFIKNGQNQKQINEKEIQLNKDKLNNFQDEHDQLFKKYQQDFEVQNKQRLNFTNSVNDNSSKFQSIAQRRLEFKNQLSIKAYQCRQIGISLDNQNEKLQEIFNSYNKVYQQVKQQNQQIQIFIENKVLNEINYEKLLKQMQSCQFVDKLGEFSVICQIQKEFEEKFPCNKLV